MAGCTIYAQEHDQLTGTEDEAHREKGWVDKVLVEIAQCDWEKVAVKGLGG